MKNPFQYGGLVSGDAFRNHKKVAGPDLRFQILHCKLKKKA